MVGGGSGRELIVKEMPVNPNHHGAPRSKSGYEQRLHSAITKVKEHLCCIVLECKSVQPLEKPVGRSPLKLEVEAPWNCSNSSAGKMRQTKQVNACIYWSTISGCLGICQWVNTYRKCGISMLWNIVQAWERTLSFTVKWIKLHFHLWLITSDAKDKGPLSSLTSITLSSSSQRVVEWLILEVRMQWGRGIDN